MQLVITKIDITHKDLNDERTRKLQEWAESNLYQTPEAALKRLDRALPYTCQADHDKEHQVIRRAIWRVLQSPLRNHPEVDGVCIAKDSVDGVEASLAAAVAEGTSEETVTSLGQKVCADPGQQQVYLHVNKLGSNILVPKDLTDDLLGLTGTPATTGLMKLREIRRTAEVRALQGNTLLRYRGGSALLATWLSNVLDDWDFPEFIPGDAELDVEYQDPYHLGFTISTITKRLT